MLKPSVSGTLPRVDSEGATVAVSQPRPTSRESRGSTPRSSQRGNALPTVTSIAPRNPDSLNSVQRLGVRKPLSRGSPRAGVTTGEVGEGSEWLQEVGSQMNQFAELNRSIINLWQTARKVDLVSLPPDPRLHSTQGRKDYAEDRKNWLANTGEHAHKNDHAEQMAIHQFAGLFAAEEPGRETPGSP